MPEPGPEDFGWSRLVAENPERLLPPETDFQVFQIDVKSDSEFGQAAHNHTLKVLEKLSDLGIDRDWRVELLRVNAEVPANPIRRRAVWFVNPETKTAVGVEHKYHED